MEGVNRKLNNKIILNIRPFQILINNKYQASMLRIIQQINLMRKIIQLLILLAFLLVNTSSQITPTSTQIILGSFSTKANLDNTQFETVLSFVFTEHPQIKDYNLIDVQTQVVSGTNYILKLQSPEGCETKIKVYVPISGNMSITSYVPSSSCQTNTGNYVIQLTPSGYQFQASLNQALSQNLQYLRSDLVLVETQTVSGTNYRFTFRNNTGYLNQIVIYSPPLSSFSPQNMTIIQYVDNYADISNDPNQYETPLTFIYQDYPQYQGYKIVGIQKQVVAGTNYKVGLQNNTLNTINYASFLVTTDISGTTVATQTSWINIYGYTVQQINEGCTSSLQLHPQINGFTITKINNVWPNEGLMLTYFKDEQQYEVFIYQLNGQAYNIIS